MEKKKQGVIWKESSWLFRVLLIRVPAPAAASSKGSSAPSKRPCARDQVECGFALSSVFVK